MKKLLIALLVGFAFQLKAQDATPTVTVQRFRIAVQGGFSRLLAKTSDAVPAESRDYVSELKSGSHLGADITYFVKPTWGLGVKFSRFKSANDSGPITFSGIQTTMSDDISHSFIGPSFSTKYTTANTKHTFFFALALGYLGYHNNATLAGQSIKMTSGTFGSALDAGYDFNLTRNIAIGTQISLTGGTLTKMDYSNGGVKHTQTFEKDQKESLSRLDVSLGARFNF